MSSLENDVRQFCVRHGLKLNKDLGQHFLVNEMVLAKIIECGNIKEDDHVIEIGAGIGVLTRELLKKTPHVTSIEIDEHLIPLLKQFIRINESTSKRVNEFTIIQANALQVPLPNTRYKIIANIPYHITSPLLRHAFLEAVERPTSLTLLIQREVAEKICDTKDAGLLTIIVGLFGTAHIAINVPPSAFLPPPKVDSAVLQIDCYEKSLAEKDVIEAVITLAKLGFSQKRKMLRNTIGSLPNGMERLAAVNIEATRRPQTLSLTEWIALAKTGN